MTEEPLQTQSASAPPDDVSRLSLVSEFINNEMAAEENLKLADPFTPNFGDAVSGETGGGGGGGGVLGLREDLQSRVEDGGRPPGTLPPLDLSEQEGKTEGYRTGRIEELMETLECPVCLDTADTPPIYQCPEGHLICKVRSQIQENV